MKITEQDIVKYDKLLTDFQPDLRYIIRKYRNNFHALSEEEIVSEVNARLSRHKSRYINNDRACLTKQGFAKFAYACAKNAVFWTMKGATKKEERYRNDFISCSFLTPAESDKTESLSSFKLINSAKEESFLKEIDRPNKSEVVLKWITEYSDFLTEKEMIVFKCYMSDQPQRETALMINETRQSVSSILKTVAQKINSHIKVHLNQDNSLIRTKKGYQSINHLFR